MTKEETEKEREERKGGKLRGEQEVEFYAEDQVLQHCLVGTKLEADVKHLNCGIWFLDRVYQVYCSFDAYLVNEKMLEWKEPKAVAPRSVDEDAEGETIAEDEGANDGGMQGDIDGDGDKENIPAVDMDREHNGQ